MNKRTLEMLGRLQGVGLSLDDALALRRIAMTLHRWFELECGTGNGQWTYSIERDGDEDDSPPYLRAQGWLGGQWSDTRYRIPDRETGARKRLDKIMGRYPTLGVHVQGDPRGWPLYILPNGVSADNYNRGIAVHR